MSQSKGVITRCQQLVYITEWFTEMSELQTQDFMKYLIQKYRKSGQQLDIQFINGFSQLGVSSDRPASIFQCRMKLFSEWFPQWSDEEKQELLIRLRNIDPKFMDEFQSNVESNSTTANGSVTDDYQSTGGGPLINGNIDDDSKRSEQLVANGFVASDEIIVEEVVESKPELNEEEEVVLKDVEEVDEPVVESTEAQEVVEINEEVIVTEEREPEECLKTGTDELMVTNDGPQELAVN